MQSDAQQRHLCVGACTLLTCCARWQGYNRRSVLLLLEELRLAHLIAPTYVKAALMKYWGLGECRSGQSLTC